MEITRQKVTSRGGGIEIDLTEYGYPDHYMGAYQNHLGGGLLGRIHNDCTVSDWKENERLIKVAKTLAEYLHSLTNPDSEWESATFEEIQRRPISAY